MAKLSTYRYEIILKLIGKGKPQEIPCEGIRSVIVNYDYDNYHMPIIYISLNIMSKQYTKLANEIDTATLNLSIKKFNSNSKSGAKKTYINSEFLYFLPTTEENQTEDLDEPLDKEDAHQPYKSLTIGLLDKKLVKNNMKEINGIYKGVNMITLAYGMMSHMGPLVIEPFDNNSPLGTVVVPPISTVYQALKYFNKRKAFYNSNFRYFQDFKVAYLLSSRSKAIDANDGQYTNVIFDISSSHNTLRQQQTSGLILDSESQSYLIYVDSAEAQLIKNRATEKEVNKIMGVLTNGSSSSKGLTVNNVTPGTRYKFERLPFENSSYVNSLAGELESNVDQVLITKNELDSSVITPNKRYNIETYEGASGYIGDYVIAQKKDVFIKQDEEFNAQTLIQLRRKPKK